MCVYMRKVGYCEVGSLVCVCIPVTLLHYTNLFDDILEVRIHWDLFDGQQLPRLLVHCLVHCSIGPEGVQTQYTVVMCTYVVHCT